MTDEPSYILEVIAKEIKEPRPKIIDINKNVGNYSDVNKPVHPHLVSAKISVPEKK